MLCFISFWMKLLALKTLNEHIVIWNLSVCVCAPKSALLSIQLLWNLLSNLSKLIFWSVSKYKDDLGFLKTSGRIERTGFKPESSSLQKTTRGGCFSGCIRKMRDGYKNNSLHQLAACRGFTFHFKFSWWEIIY